MNNEIEKYNALQTEENHNICNRFMNEINSSLTNSGSKIWHGSPVWFIDGIGKTDITVKAWSRPVAAGGCPEQTIAEVCGIAGNVSAAIIEP